MVMMVMMVHKSSSSQSSLLLASFLDISRLVHARLDQSVSNAKQLVGSDRWMQYTWKSLPALGGYGW
uniref:Putative secreted protein n=1 Tax=Anopheles triannulatus TaxID=58253 RepID=A0A2M4B696_9DIPT